MSISEFLNLLTLVVLAGITWWYAKQTRDIAKATKDQAQAAKAQADSSVRMAKEMEKSALSAVRPIIAIEAQGSSAQSFEVKLKNVGAGPAVNLTCYMDCADFPLLKTVGKRIHLQVLGVGQEHDQGIATTDIANFGWREDAIIRAEYEDIFGRPFHSSLVNREGVPVLEILPGKHTEAS